MAKVTYLGILHKVNFTHDELKIVWEALASKRVELNPNHQKAQFAETAMMRILPKINQGNALINGIQNEN